MSPAAPKRAERWARILLESAQQARCLRPPVLRRLMNSAEGFRLNDAAERANIIAYLRQLSGK